MSEILLEKLLASFDELDLCILKTFDFLAKKNDVSSDIVQRVHQYSDIVTKQRSLAVELKKHIEVHDWNEVSRHMKMINALSSMIKEDALSILSGSTEVINSDNTFTLARS